MLATPLDPRAAVDELRVIRAAYAPPAAVVSGAAEDETTHRALLALLRRSGASFGEMAHAPTRTSAESAAVRGASLSSGAKALLLRAGKPLSHGSPHVLAVMPASHNLSWERAREVLGAAKLSLAPMTDVAALTGCIPGAVPPFGSLFVGVRTLVDPALLAQGPAINFNSGLRTHSVLRLAVADYLRIESPEIVAICEDEQQAS